MAPHPQKTTKTTKQKTIKKTFKNKTKTVLERQAAIKK